MEAYEFYWPDSYGKDHLIGILSERRKDPKRITNKLVMNWERKIVGNKPGLNLKNVYFVQVKAINLAGGRNFSWKARTPS